MPSAGERYEMIFTHLVLKSLSNASFQSNHEISCFQGSGLNMLTSTTQHFEKINELTFIPSQIITHVLNALWQKYFLQTHVHSSSMRTFRDILVCTTYCRYRQAA
jgi:hypothetical protein